MATAEASFGWPKRASGSGIDLIGKRTAQRRARREGVSIDFIEADITAYPFDSKTCDAIIVSEVLHLLTRDSGDQLIDRVIKSTDRGGVVYISILSSMKRTFLSTGEEFVYEGEASYSSAEAEGFLRRKFVGWDIIELVRFHDELDWPLTPGKHPVEPYHWSCDYMCFTGRR